MIWWLISWEISLNIIVISKKKLAWWIVVLTVYKQLTFKVDEYYIPNQEHFYLAGMFSYLWVTLNKLLSRAVWE